MGPHIANEVIRLMVRKGINPVKARVLILGLAFKENCPDLRNTRVVDILQALQGYNTSVDIHDPWINAAEAEHEYAITPIAQPQLGSYDAVIVAVGHQQFVTMGAAGIRALGKPTSVVYDVKCLLPRDTVDGRL
jgi:UDP-N-acetyl-D-galactosamine dehydrogenase